jgi:hypothetical protein
MGIGLEQRHDLGLACLSFMLSAKDFVLVLSFEALYSEFPLSAGLAGP